jgi:hypothetical protein
MFASLSLWLPVVDMKIHAPISAIEEGMNPDSTATAGKARMPENYFNFILSCTRN